jgi:uncharacterized membrane protein
MSRRASRPSARDAAAYLVFGIGLIAYIVAVVTLADWMLPPHWIIQLFYYVLAGIIWIWPTMWLADRIRKNRPPSKPSRWEG